MTTLAETVRVARRFQRSLRIDTDLGNPDALQGFVCHVSAAQVLLGMAEQFQRGGQRAFTWTGPYGSGKSSLALVLGALLGPAGPGREAAIAALGADVAGQICEVFQPSAAGWLIVPVVGRRADPVEEVGQALQRFTSAVTQTSTHPVRAPSNSASVVAQLLAAAAARPEDGVLLLVDELGKYLDGVASDHADIHFFQDLAELASRSSHRFLIVGILHQSFDQYARRLGRDARDEWAKIQGRFVDIPLIVAVDEVVDLVGRAIEVDDARLPQQGVVDRVAEAMQLRRPSSPADLADRLHRCWPLHPVTAALLGPMSRRRFGQNERSVFGFLSSAEPGGFQEFLKTTQAESTALFGPDRLWDYLRINLEPAILASNDSHRWAQGVDAVERCEARGGSPHVALAKCLAVIDLFRGSANVAADPLTLCACFPEMPEPELRALLAELERWSVAVFRKHLNAWAVYSGSDFEIETALDAARAQLPGLDLQRLAQLGGLHTVLAKRHYYSTGNLRWFQCELVDLERLEALQPTSADAAGRLLLAIPSDELTHEASLLQCAEASLNLGRADLIAIGLPTAGGRIRELGLELLAVQALQLSRPELAGDSVARREISARRLALESDLEQQLRASFNAATWFVAGVAVHATPDSTMTSLASELADQCFSEAPHIHSELVNRQRPSSNTQAGVRDLLHAMVGGANRPYLGIEGFPIERGLYSTVVASAGLHRAVDGEYQFVPPDHGVVGETYQAMWLAAKDVLAASPSTVALSAIYRRWAAPPFGIRRGVMPILATAFVLAHAKQLAVYSEGQFQADIDAYFVDVLLQGEAHVALRWIVVDDEQAAQVAAMATAANAVGSANGAQVQPLEIARALVRRARELPQWTRKTARLSPVARDLRRLLLQAHDPHQLLFTDLPAILPRGDLPTFTRALEAALAELADAYERMLRQLNEQLLRAVHHAPDLPLEALRERARTIQNRSGDFRVDAFAVRLANYHGELSEIEAVASLAISRPPREWSDRDVDEAGLALADFAVKFCRAETLVRVQGREGKREAMALIIGTGGPGRAVVREFEVQDRDRPKVEHLAHALASFLAQHTEDRNLMLAALAEAGALADTLDIIKPMPSR